MFERKKSGCKNILNEALTLPSNVVSDPDLLQFNAEHSASTHYI